MSNEEEGFPERSLAGRAALDIFYLEFNDVNFYVEDVDQENLYECILKKFFSNIQIARIFPLGGKTNILRHAQDIVNKSTAPSKIYLVDKDFDDLLETVFSDHRVVYLDRYCIENYLLEESALIELLIETYPKKKKEELIEDVSLSKTIDLCIDSLRPLFTLFFLTQKLKLGLRNCDSKPEEFCIPKKLWKLNEEAINSYAQELVNYATAARVEPTLDDPYTDYRASPAKSADAHSLISGKFLLAMIFHYIKSKYSLGSISFESFVFRMAKNSTLTSLTPIVAKIEYSLGLQVRS